MSNKIDLVLINESHKEMVCDYKQEMVDAGASGLNKFENFESWYQSMVDIANITDSGGDLVRGTTYIALKNDSKEIVGMINIRHELNDYLLQYGGHIGYGVRKSQRKKGYATEMLKQSLEICKELNIDRVLVTCDKDNIASAKVILNNNGVLENEVFEDSVPTQRYWIDNK